MILAWRSYGNLLKCQLQSEHLAVPYLVGAGAKKLSNTLATATGGSCVLGHPAMFNRVGVSSLQRGVQEDLEDIGVWFYTRFSIPYDSV